MIRRNFLILITFLTTVVSQPHVTSPRPYAIVNPVKGKTQLRVDEEGLAFIRALSGPVIPVVVIGPYRSGKSFLLNQLLHVDCNQGFEVGHTRSTQTKGIWVWGQPQPIVVDGRNASLVFMDTEGFEATGKSDAYDDRIFALSTVMASLLIYNLPETVRESDIQKLSFAVELADAFFYNGQAGDHPSALQPATMLWLIQRDFLQGKSVGEMVKTALAEQPNPENDKDIMQVNRIRQSLSLVASNSTAFGLTQPHLNRTSLCTLSDNSLDPQYILQRSRLQDLVVSMAHPKAVRGAVMTGPALAGLIQQMVEALNLRDIPSAGSMLEYFNKDLLYSVKDSYIARLEEQALPVSEDDLDQWQQRAAAAAFATFDHDKFGGRSASGSAGTLRDVLVALIRKEHRNRQVANTLRSSQDCEAAEQLCEDELETDQHMALPSTGRIRSHFFHCESAFQKTCVGPALNASSIRLQKAWQREESRFRRDYNDKILNGLIIISLIDIVLFRFVFRIHLLETVGWAAFVFLQVYPKLYMSGGSIYDSRWWRWLLRGWEATVWSGIDLQRWAPVCVPIAVASWLIVKSLRRFGALRWLSASRRRSKRVVPAGMGAAQGDVRDLDV